MKILFLNHNYKEQGTYFRAFYFAKYMAKNGHDCTVMTMSRKSLLFPVKYTDQGVKVIETPHFLDVDGGGWAPFDLWYRIWHAMTNEYDLIYGFCHKPTVYFPALIGRAMHKRTAFLSDWSDWWGKGGINSAKRPKPESFIEEFLEEDIKRRADAVTAISTKLKERALGLGIPQERIFTPYLGCDTERIKPVSRPEAAKLRAKLGIPADRKVMMFIGFGMEALGMVLEAFHELKKRGSTACFVVVGPLEKFLKRKFDASPYKKDIIVTGRLPFDRVREYAVTADVFMLPMSDRLENWGRFPQKTGDYMSAGRPIIASPVGDIIWFLEKYRMGMTARFEPGDMADKVGTLFADAELAEEMGRNARRAAEEIYSWERTTCDVIEKAAAMAVRINAEKRAAKKVK